MFPPKPPCLDVQAMPALKPKPVLRPTSKKLHTKLINCRDKLFFVAFENKWCLVGVAYKDTMSLNPNCLQDGKFLVDFYILRPKDYWFGAPNQRFWLEYHRPGSSSFVRRKSSYHLIQPSRKSRLYAASKGLVPWQRRMYFLYNNVFIHGPFDFTMTANGRQSKYIVSVKEWRILHKHRDLDSNDPPSMKVVSRLSLHCTPLFHTKPTLPKLMRPYYRRHCSRMTNTAKPPLNARFYLRGLCEPWYTVIKPPISFLLPKCLLCRKDLVEVKEQVGWCWSYYPANGGL